MTITGITFTSYANNGLNYGDDLSKSLGVFDYTGDIDALLNGTGGVTAFTDLGSGTSYGSTAVTKGTTFNESMPLVSIGLDAAAVAEANAALGGTDMRFVLGLSLLESYTTTNTLYWGSDSIPAGYLTIEYASVPAPTVLGLFSIGLLGVGAATKRRTKLQ